MRKYKLVLSTILLNALLIVSSCSNETANSVAIEAKKKWDEADKSDDIQTKISLISSSIEILSSIPDKFPNHDMSLKILGGGDVAGISLPKLSEQLSAELWNGCYQLGDAICSDYIGGNKFIDDNLSKLHLYTLTSLLDQGIPKYSFKAARALEFATIGPPDNFLESAARTVARAGHLDEAISIVEQISDQTTRDRGYSSVVYAVGCHTTNDWANLIFEKIENQDIKNNATIRLERKKEKFCDSEEKNIKKTDEKSISYEDLSSEYEALLKKKRISQGDVEKIVKKAMDLGRDNIALELMKRLPVGVSSLTAAEFIARGYIKNGQYETAVKFYEQSHLQVGDGFFKLQIAGELAAGLVEISHFDDLKKFLKKFDIKSRNEIVGSVMSEHIENDRMNFAFAFFKYIEGL